MGPTDEDRAWDAYDPPRYRPGDEHAFREGFRAGVLRGAADLTHMRRLYEGEKQTQGQLETDILRLESEVEELQINEVLTENEYEAKLAKRDRLFTRLYEGEDLEWIMEEYRRMRADEILAEVPEGDGQLDND